MAFYRRLYRVAKKLRYREIPRLFGKSLTVQNIEDIPESVARQFGLGSSADQGVRYEGMMAKYNLLDLSFHTDLKLGLEDRGGVRQLKDLHFLGTERDQEDEDWCLEALEESIDKGETTLKLFLKTESQPERTPEERSTGRLPPGYLPRRFVVEDACIANASYVWIHKHFYL